jgi:ATP-binding cassette, subfamily C (CFTR/MRP), member 1
LTFCSHPCPGANLSGGQKARLSLARAVYADADTVLLDDPLAALDPRVGRTVFQECILGTLHGKTRVLVTQALHFLPQVDHIIVVDDGTIVEQGSYAQLYRANGQLKKMVDGMENRSKNSSKKSAAAQDTTVVKSEVKRDEHVSSALTSEEDVVTGAISGKTWWGYLKAAGGWRIIGSMFIALLVQQVGAVMMNQWLQWWTRNQFNDKIGVWIGIYNGIGVSVAILLSGYQFSHNPLLCPNVIVLVLVNVFILAGALNASRTFHNRAFSGVLGAPMSWFHANPAGRVINRFSKDVESVDQRLMPQLFQAIASFGSLITTMTLISRSAPVLICESHLSTFKLATDLVYRSSSKCFHDP